MSERLEPWARGLPPNWELVPLRTVATRGYKTFTDGDWVEAPYIDEAGPFRLIQTGNVGIGEFREQGFRFVSERTFRELACTEVLPGDVLICRLASPVGRACLAPSLGVRMITSVDVCILRPRPNYEARFLVYFLSSLPYLDWMDSICRGGTRDRVSRAMLGRIPVPGPPLEEQRAIVRFLDEETAKIDALIERKRDLQRRITEQQEADVIVSLFKEGGKSRWVRLRDVTKLIQTGPFGSQLHFDDYSSGGVPIVNPAHIASGTIRVEDAIAVSEVDAARLGRHKMVAGDVVLARRGAMGRCAVVRRREEGWLCGSGSMIVRHNPKYVLPEFLQEVISAKRTREWLELESRGTTMDNLNASVVGRIPIPLVTIDHQQRILDELRLSRTQSSALKAKLGEGLTLLSEYRSALIATAVSGALDVL